MSSGQWIGCTLWLLLSMIATIYTLTISGIHTGEGGGEPGTSPPPKKLYFIHYDNQEKLIQLFSIKPLLYQIV